MTVVEQVDFAVPTAYTIGERFPTWQEAVERAATTMTGTRYKGQKLNPDSPGFHPKRFVADGDDLLVFSRAFVQMRVVEPIQDRPGRGRSGHDGVAMTWEVFHDGTAEALKDES